MLAYKIVIQQNDTGSTQVFDTGKVTLANPFYGNDRNGNTQIFSANAITAAQLSTAGIVNGYSNGYKILITQWWGATDSDSITQTSPSFFFTRSAPTLSISLPSYTESNPYNQKSITVNALFSQAQGDTVKTVRWYLYDGQQAVQSNLLLDTGDIETQLLELYYDGLFPNTYYLIQVSVQTSSGVTVSTQNTIYVEYPLGESVGEVVVCKPVGKDYVQVSWNARSNIDGVPSGEITYENGCVNILDQDDLTYSPLSILEPWTIVWRGSADISNNIVDAVEINGENDSAVISLTNTEVSLILNGNIIFSKAITGHSSDTFTIIITPTHYYIRQDTFTGGTLPSLTLYPSNALYPSDITPVTYQYDAAITYNQFEINSIVLIGHQTCDYIWIESGELPQDKISLVLGDSYYEPIIDYNTMFLSNFDAQTTTAYMSGTGGNGLGSSVYRREYGKQILEHVIDVSGGTTSIRDYGAKSRKSYQYFVFVVGTDIYAEAFGSDSIIPYYNNYLLTECVYNVQDMAYHVQSSYAFTYNVSQGSISNNNTPSIMQNFTRYPNRQSVNTRYASWSLSALIGSVNQAQASYEDSWEIADKISSLSTSLNPKFLRDMKGNIWRVETSEAIITDINIKNKFMPIKVTIPFVEVGSADGVSIVATPLDPAYTE